MITGARLALVLTIGVWALGCASSLVSTRSKSPLAPFKPSLETSTLEVVFVRHAYELPSLGEELWSSVDETAISVDVRGTLAQNGLRAGLITGELPPALQSALSGQTSDAASGELPASGAADQLQTAPAVTRRTLHSLPGQRSELLTSAIYERLPLLVRDGRDVHGEVYAKARCVLAVEATPLGDQRVRVSLTPEVQHGEPRQQFRGGDDGVWRIDAARPKVALEKMAFDMVLSPGQSIILGTSADRPGSAGHYFFTEPVDGQLEQKLLLIRFDGTKYDSLLVSQQP